MVQHVYDGSISFSGGQNDGMLPENIREDQYFQGINVTTKSGGLSPRPGFEEVNIELVDDIKIDSLKASQIYSNGKFQSLAPYETEEGRSIIAVISGVIFKIDPMTGMTEVLLLPNNDRINQYKNRVHWTQAGRFLVLFDWPNEPVIIDKGEARRANPNRTEPTLGTPQPEVPTSVLGTFVQNRLWIANETSEFTAGDPIGTGFPDAPITFEEVLVSGSPYYLQFFSLGSQSINTQITAMGFIQIADTSTGYGPLFIATRDSIYTYAANTQRTNWENTSFGKLSLFNAGISGPRAFTNVNSDLIFQDSFGQVRSLTTSRQEQQQWGNSPISREIEGFIKNSNRDLLTYAFVERFDNRVFSSVQPYYARAFDTYGKQTVDIAHKGIAVLELNNINGLLQDVVPAWSGAWSGVNPLDMVRGKDYIYILSKDNGIINRLYRVVEDRGSDRVNDLDIPIISRVETRGYDFNSPFLDKVLVSADYTITNISGEPFRFKSEYITEGPRWSKWRTWLHMARSCTQDAECSELNVLNKHSFKNIKLGDPDEKECNDITKNLITTFRDIRLRITIEGNDWLLKRLRIKAEANPEIESEEVQCDDLEGVDIISDCKEIGAFDLEANSNFIFEGTSND